MIPSLGFSLETLRVAGNISSIPGVSEAALKGSRRMRSLLGQICSFKLSSLVTDHTRKGFL